MEFLWGRYALLFYITCAFVLTAAASFEYLAAIPFAGLLSLLTVVGWWDFSQKKHSVLGNYPLLGRFRFMFESIRPELRQYFGSQTQMNCLFLVISELWFIKELRD